MPFWYTSAKLNDAYAEEVHRGWPLRALALAAHLELLEDRVRQRAEGGLQRLHLRANRKWYTNSRISTRNP